MELQEKFNTIMTEHKSELESFEKAVLSGILTWIYMEYASSVKHLPNKDKLQLHVPLLKKVKDNILSKDTKFMKMLSNKLIDDIHKNESIQCCIDYPELSIFHHSKVPDSDIIKVIFDIEMINNISETIIKLLSVVYKLNDKSTNVVEDPNLEFCDNSTWEPDDAYDFVLNQIIHHLIIETKSFLTDKNTTIELLDNNFNVPLPDNFVVSVRSKELPCDVYFTPSIVSSRFYDDLSVITNTNIKLAKDVNSVHILYSGQYNQVYVFKNSDEVF